MRWSTLIEMMALTGYVFASDEIVQRQWAHGNDFLGSGYEAQALQAYDVLLKDTHRDLEMQCLLVNKGLALAKSGRWDEALAQLQAVSSKEDASPFVLRIQQMGFAKVYLERSEEFLQQDHYKEAYADILNAEAAIKHAQEANALVTALFGDDDGTGGVLRTFHDAIKVMYAKVAKAMATGPSQDTPAEAVEGAIERQKRTLNRIDDEEFVPPERLTSHQKWMLWQEQRAPIPWDAMKSDEDPNFVKAKKSYSDGVKDLGEGKMGNAKDSFSDALKALEALQKDMQNKPPPPQGGGEKETSPQEEKPQEPPPKAGTEPHEESMQQLLKDLQQMQRDDEKLQKGKENIPLKGLRPW